MKTNYLKKRVEEIFQLIDLLTNKANEDTETANDILKQVKEAEDDEVRIALMKKFKKTQFFNNLKFSDIEKITPVLIELISLAKLMDVDLELTEFQEDYYTKMKPRFSTIYKKNKGNLELVYPELEKIVEKEIENPSETELDAINKMVETLKTRDE